MVVNGFEWCNCLDGSWEPWSSLWSGKMEELPKVGQKYQHKKWGEVEVSDVFGRDSHFPMIWYARSIKGDWELIGESAEKFIEATACKP